MQTNLELIKSTKTSKKMDSLFWFLDKISMAMDGRLLESWIERLLLSVTEINRRQKMVQALLDGYFTREKVIDSLKGVYDLERLTGRIAFGSVNACEMLRLAYSLGTIPDTLNSLLEANNSHLQNFVKQINPLEGIHDLIVNTIMDNPPLLTTEGGLIREGVSDQLGRYRDAMNNRKKWLSEMESHEREVTGINNLKVGYDKVFGYYIEVTNSNKDKIPTDRCTRKQTLINAGRCITPELKEHESLILEAEAKSTGLEYDPFVKLRESVRKYIPALQKLAK